MMTMCKTVLVGMLGFGAMAAAAEDTPSLRGARHVASTSFERELKNAVHQGADAPGVDAAELWSKLVWPAGNSKKLFDALHDENEVLCDGCDETDDFVEDNMSFSYSYDSKKLSDALHYENEVLCDGCDETVDFVEDTMFSYSYNP